jgi:hypothetical protein
MDRVDHFEPNLPRLIHVIWHCLHQHGHMKKIQASFLWNFFSTNCENDDPKFIQDDPTILQHPIKCIKMPSNPVKPYQIPKKSIWNSIKPINFPQILGATPYNTGIVPPPRPSCDASRPPLKPSADCGRDCWSNALPTWHRKMGTGSHGHLAAA